MLIKNKEIHKMMNVTLVSEYDFDDVVNNDIFIIIFFPYLYFH